MLNGMTRVFIVGAGKGGERVLNHLMPIPSLAILGVFDCNPAAPAIQIAQKARLPVFFTDLINILQTLDLDIVLDLTGDPAIRSSLLHLSENRFEVASGEVISLFINAINEAKEKEHLLNKHLDISLMISQSRTLKEVFDTIVAEGMAMTCMPAGSLAMYNTEKETFTLLSQKGLPVRLSQRVTFPLRHGGFTHYLLTNREPVIIPDLAKSTLFDSTLLIRDGICSVIAIPLVSEREFLGILFYNDFQPHYYPDNLVHLFRQFALEAVMAIQKQTAIAHVRSLSSRDALTGLYNRSQFLNQLKEAVLRAEQTHQTLSILLCDLDRFKELNETLGHEYGDQVLKQTADDLRMIFTEDEAKGHNDPLLFRSGADEISVIIPDITPEKLLQKALIIRKTVQDMTQKVYFPMDISIGGAVYPHQSGSSDQLMIRAARSLLIAKREPEKICIGAIEEMDNVERVYSIFEPIIDPVRNQVIGYEALSRDALGKSNIQDLFKKYAEWGGLDELQSDCFVAQLKKAHQMGLSRIFLNVNSHILIQCQWVEKPSDIDVVLEISESEAIQDVEAYLTLTEQWRNKGFRFAMDDFGAGFISLPFLSMLRPEYIKIDRSVMLRAVASSEFLLFLRKLVAALQGKTTHQMIAEGIETEIELQRMQEVGIHLVQGFLLKDQGHPTLSSVPKD